MMKALIVVDMQNDFLTGSLANPDAVAIIPKIKELIKSKEYDQRFPWKADYGICCAADVR